MWPSSPRVITRFLSFLLFASASCWAQFSGSIQGTVQDPANALVPNAKVQLKNNDTGIAASTASDTSGVFRFISLAPGKYSLTIDA
jgi:protocatechuate 3,4-dioxygenase beta subunit